MAIDTEELSFIADLFDDSDPVVRECVDRKILSMGRDVIPALEELRHRSVSVEAKRLISDKLTQYNAEFRIADLRRLAEGDAVRAFPLREGCFVVSSMLNPQIGREEFEEALYQCSCEYRQELSEQRTALENMALFNHIFFHRLRFTICDPELTDLRQASVFDTLHTRRGNPFTIACIYMMLAEEVSLPLFPLCFPGGFVPAYVEKGHELFYVNLFQNGEIFAQTHLRDYMIEQGIPFDHNRFLLRKPNVLVNIYLESLLYINTAAGDDTTTAIVRRAIAALGGERFLETGEAMEE